MKRAALAIVCAVGLSACSDAPSMLDPHAPQAHRIADVWWLMFVLAVGVFLIVTAFVVWAIVRRRADTTSSADAERRDRRFVLLGGLVVPTVVLAVVAVATVRTTNALQPTGDGLQIHVSGVQWWWRVTYPDLGVTTANEIHVPVGTPVDITLTSEDVVHSLWVPQLNGKADLIPGQTNHLSFTASEAGTYRGQCAEFCGLEHARMAFVVIAEPPDAFRAWAAAEGADAVTPSRTDATAGEQLFVNGSCAGCHSVKGTTAVGVLGPDLTHIGSRQTLAALSLPNTTDGMRKWLSDTQGVKPGAHMPQIDLTPDQITALVAYLEGLT